MSYAKNEPSPGCPYCFDGETVIDKFGIMYCSACKKNIYIRKID